MIPEPKEYAKEVVKKVQNSEKKVSIQPRQLLKQMGVYSLSDVKEVLDLTIKRDDENKLMCFLAMLSTYTEDDAFNVLFNNLSSTGKSYIALEVGKLFPKEDVNIISQASPTAFFHDFGEFDKERKIVKINMSRKIYIFTDQPHYELLARLRSLLSHDTKVVVHKITNKKMSSGLRTENIEIIGYPTVIFCSARLSLDQQELTRLLTLSPETDAKKISEGISEKLRYETDRATYKKQIEENEKRKDLIEYIRAIKECGIDGVRLNNPKLIEELFNQTIISLKPRHMRDISRINSLIKAITILKATERARPEFIENKDNYLTSTDEDIYEAFNLWNYIAQSVELDVTPFVLDVYKRVILPLLDDSVSGVSRQDILNNFRKVFKRSLPAHILQRDIIPQLTEAGLCYEEQNPLNKRELMLFGTADTPTRFNNHTPDFEAKIVNGENEDVEEMGEIPL